MLKLDPQVQPSRPSDVDTRNKQQVMLVSGRRSQRTGLPCSPTRVARMLIRRSLSLLGVGLAISLTGCGGTSDNPVTPNIYRGAWTGSWQSATAGDDGSISFTIYPDGSLTGSMTRRPGTSATLVGTVNAHGQMVAVAGFGAEGNFEMEGAVVLTTNLLGSFRYRFLGVEYNASFSCVPSTGGG
jgi:hypothetical protein